MHRRSADLQIKHHCSNIFKCSDDPPCRSIVSCPRGLRLTENPVTKCVRTCAWKPWTTQRKSFCFLNGRGVAFHLDTMASNLDALASNPLLLFYLVPQVVFT